MRGRWQDWIPMYGIRLCRRPFSFPAGPGIQRCIDFVSFAVCIGGKGNVYGDNRGIIADCVDEIQPFIDEVLPAEDEDSEIKTENIEVVIPADDYLV